MPCLKLGHDELVCRSAFGKQHLQAFRCCTLERLRKVIKRQPDRVVGVRLGPCVQCLVKCHRSLLHHPTSSYPVVAHKHAIVAIHPDLA